MPTFAFSVLIICCMCTASMAVINTTMEIQTPGMPLLSPFLNNIEINSLLIIKKRIITGYALQLYINRVVNFCWPWLMCSHWLYRYEQHARVNTGCDECVYVFVYALKPPVKFDCTRMKSDVHPLYNFEA